MSDPKKDAIGPTLVQSDALLATLAPQSDATLATLAPSSGNISTSPAPLSGRVDALVIVEREHYEILGEFGRGGLGRVLRARDRRTGRIVAIKEALRSTPALLARFAREAVVTANLQHPAIVPVYEVGRWPTGDPFYAMKLVAGKSLDDAARAMTTMLERLSLLPHVIAVADALAYAHGERVIHRDLKPANVLIGDYGETVVIDWGLAKRLDDIEDASQASTLPPEGETTIGSVLGTPGYMAPEQARGDTADARSDVYAIGAMLYEVLSRVRPYSEIKEIDEMIRLAATQPPRPLAEVDPTIPRELVAIVERAMAFAPEARYRDAKALADDLKRFQTGQLVGAHQYTAWMLMRRWIRKHRTIVIAAAVGSIALGALGGFSIIRIRAARDRALASQAIAEDRAAALAEEQGRQLTIAGDAPRALPYLAAAVDAGRRSPALDFVLARALEVLDPVEAVLTGAALPIAFASYSPDGKRLITGGDDLAIRLWDPHSHALLATLGRALTARWSGDGSYIAGVDVKSTVELHDPATGAVLRTLHPVLADAPAQLAISDRGDRIAVVGSSGVLTVWDAKTGAALVSVHAHTSEIVAVAFSRDGSMVATASRDQSGKVWRVADGKLLATLPHADVVNDVAFAPDGKRVASASIDASAIVWDLATGAKVLALAHKESVESVRFDPSGKHILTGSADTTAAVWDAATGARIATLDVGHRLVEALYSVSGTRIATRDEHGDVKLWADDGAPIATFSGHVGSTEDAEFSPDGTQLASTGVDGDVRLWRVDRPRTEIALGPWAGFAPTPGVVAWRGTFSPDGKQIAVTGSDNVARIYDGESGALVHELRGHTANITWIAFAPDGAHVATASDDTTARIWNAAGTSVLTLAAGAQKVRFIGYSPDGKQLATTHGDGTARLWDATTGAPIATLAPPRGAARVVVWSPDGTRLVTPLDGPGAIIWDATGRMLAAAEMATTRVQAVTWSHDGGELVLGADTRLVETFDGRTGARRAELVGHTLGPIMAIEPSPDGEHLMTAGGDGVARIWHGTTQRLVIGAGLSRIMSAAYRPDGALIATGESDGQVSVWDATTGKELGRLAGDHGVTQLHWSADGRRLLVLHIEGPPVLWVVPEWHGSSAELAARLRCTLRWRLDDATLVPASPDPSACKS